VVRATHHICKNKDQFETLIEKQHGKVTVANGHEVKILGEGTICEKILLPNGKTNKIHIKNVLYVRSGNEQKFIINFTN
jgi:hypothetical protein